MRFDSPTPGRTRRISPASSNSRKVRLQVCALRPSAAASSAMGNRRRSVLGMGKARPAGRALVSSVWLSVSGWTKFPEVEAMVKL